jgi:protoporphyrinogen oxidase
MRFAIVGAGMLGLTLAWRLAREGHDVEVLEAAPHAGGLVCPQDFGEFTWDRYYHVILPHDAHLIGLLRELGIEGELRWSPSGTGYQADGRTFDMNGMADYLRFPLLSVADKARLGAAVAYATRVADPWSLYGETAEAWLTRLCGRRGYERFWRPLLRAKFGAHHGRVAAVFIWATLTRLAAGGGGENAGKLGYVRGGYNRVLSTLLARLAERGARVHLGAAVSAIAPTSDGACEVTRATPDGPVTRAYDKVLFTAPTRAARAVLAPSLVPALDAFEAQNPTSREYLGVVCTTLVLKRPLTPYYVLNIGDESVELTGLVEMTTVVSRDETAGRSLVYLPRYMDANDPRFDEPNEAVRASMIDRGLKRLFKDFDERDIVNMVISRARYVQPLPLAGMAPDRDRVLPAWESPFTVVNTALLQCATLNNNEVVALADALAVRNLPTLRRGASATRGS